MKRVAHLVFAMALGIGVFESLPNLAILRHGFGIVGVVDTQSNTLEVLEESSGRWILRRVFVITNETKIEWAGKQITLEELQAGQHVDVYYVESENAFEAKEIQVQTAPPR